jgi:uncharacterized protein YqjF (DUF2071 family)
MQATQAALPSSGQERQLYSVHTSRFPGFTVGNHLCMLRPDAAVAAALRQRGALGEVSHRPWPLPERPWFMGQSWRHLLFAHWPVEPDRLAAAVPSQLPLDVREGAAWIGVTPFGVEGLRLRQLPPPPVASRFLEVNVRTYVTVDGKPGIYFLSLDASSRLAVAVARRTYRLPYFHARITLERNGDDFNFHSERISDDGRSAELGVSYAATGRRVPEADSLARFLAERYCLYTLSEGGRIHRADIHHPPWPLEEAVGRIEVNTMAAPYGLKLVGEPLLHFSALQDVVLWNIEPV